MSIQQKLSGGPTVMMTLGYFKFGISTAAYQELSRVTEWRWPSQERFMQAQALQFVGPGGDTITLPGVIYPEWRGGPGQLDSMRTLADRGKPQMLIDGRGMVHGRWVIEKIDERQSVFAAAGAPRKQEFTMNLRKFDDQEGGGGGLLGAIAGGAVGAVAGAVGGPAGVLASAAGTAAKLAGNIASAMNQVQGVASQIGSAASAILSSISRCVDIATGLANTAQDAKRMLGSSASAIGQASSMTQLLNASSSAVANLGQATFNLSKAASALPSLPVQAASAVQNAQTSINRLTVAATSMQASASAELKKLKP